MRKYLLLTLLVCIGTSGFTQNWLPKGPNDSNQVSYYPVGFTNMAMDTATSVPYVIFRDAGFGNKATVSRFLSGTWSIVGTPGFTANAIDYADIAIAPDGTPYIVFQKQNGPNLFDATVMKFSGGIWSVVGTANIAQQYSFNALPAAYPSIAIAIAPDNTPYIAYHDYNDPNTPLAATVKRFNGTSWVTVGNPGFTGDHPIYSQAMALDFSIAPDGTPYVLFTDNSPNLSISNMATLMMYDGASWVLVGNEGFSTGAIGFPALAIALDGMPFVAYQDQTTGNRVTVKKFDGLNWENVGTPGFSAGSSQYISLAVTSENLPIVAYKDAANGNGATVKLFDGLFWVDPGTPGFSNGSVQYPKIVLTAADMPFIVYQDANIQLKATVKKLDTDWTLVGPGGISGAPVNYVTAAASKTNNNLYAAFRDMKSGKATVMEYSSSTWSVLGSAEFTAGNADELSIAVSGAPETIYLAYRDGANGNKLTVDFLAVDGWATVGIPAFTAGAVSEAVIDVAPNGTPYVAFSDGANGNRLTVMRYDGSNWVLVGPAGFSTGIASNIALKIATDGVPYVVYLDNSSARATAKRFTGSWVNVGPAGGFSTGNVNYISLGIGPGALPYVAYQDVATGTARAQSFNGTSWSNLGAVISSGVATHISLNIDVNGNAIVAYKDAASGNRITLKKFQAGAWVALGVQGYSAGPPTDITTLVTPDNILHVVYGDGYAWTRSYVNFTPVPVTLIDFSAVKVEDKVRLQWQTDTEVNNDYFAVEHSANGKDFTEIGRVKGNNDVNEINSYELMHHNPVLGINYYRLKQVDYDLRSKLYPVRTVKFSADELVHLTIFPNPATDKITLKGNSANALSYRVINSQGQVILRKNLNTQSLISVDVSALKSGQYYLILEFRDARKTLGFIRK